MMKVLVTGDGGNLVTFKESLKLIEGYYPQVKRVYAERLKGGSSLISNEGAREVLVFHPRYSWKDLLEEK